MILDCPKCSARFLVADALIPAEGRTVRCGTCANQWRVTHPTPETDIDPALAEDGVPLITPDTMPEEIIPLRRGSNVPAIKKRVIPVKPFQIAAPLLAIGWLVLSFLTYFPHWMEVRAFSSIYKALGVTTTQGLAFSDVTMKRVDTEEGRTKFIFSGSIVNYAAVTRKVPAVHVALLGKDGKEIWGRNYPVGIELKAGEVYPFRIVNVETSFGSSIATMMLDLGHSLSLMVR